MADLQKEAKFSLVYFVSLNHIKRGVESKLGAVAIAASVLSSYLCLFGQRACGGRMSLE